MMLAHMLHYTLFQFYCGCGSTHECTPLYIQARHVQCIQQQFYFVLSFSGCVQVTDIIT